MIKRYNLEYHHTQTHTNMVEDDEGKETAVYSALKLFFDYGFTGFSFATRIIYHGKKRIATIKLPIDGIRKT